LPSSARAPSTLWAARGAQMLVSVFSKTQNTRFQFKPIQSNSIRCDANAIHTPPTKNTTTKQQSDRSGASRIKPNQNGPPHIKY